MGQFIFLLALIASLHPNLSFKMELPVDNKYSFIGMKICNNGMKIEKQVNRNSTYTGLLHFQSHADKRYKNCSLKTMIHFAYAQFSITVAFSEE